MFNGILAFLMAVQWGYVPEPPLSAPVSVCCRERGGCRTEEVCVMIDGVPITDPLWPTEVIVCGIEYSELFRVDPWRVVVPADYFVREMVLSGEWIEMRPRLRGPR